MNGRLIRAVIIMSILAFGLTACGGEGSDHSKVLEDQYQQLIQEQGQQDWTIERDASNFAEWTATERAQDYLDSERQEANWEELGRP